MVERRENFAKGDRAFVGFAAETIRGADDLAGFHSAAGQHRAADARPVVASGVFVDDRSAPELTPNDNAHVLVESTLVQVGDERRDGGLGEVRRDGLVFVNGELWEARVTNGEQLKPGDRVRVESLDGLVLTVKPVS